MAPELLPRCPNLDGTSLRIVPAYTEAGYFQEANAVTITDGERTAVYTPVAPVPEWVPHVSPKGLKCWRNTRTGTFFYGRRLPFTASAAGTAPSTPPPPQPASPARR